MAQAAQPVRLRFNCYLLRQGLAQVESALRAKYRSGGKEALRSVSPSSSAPAGARAYLGETKERTPKWAEELDAAFPGVGQISNRSNRFVIFLPIESRWFAVCFGYGSGVLEWETVEANFGLRVAARRFRSGDVTELRSRRIDASARTQSVQVPVGTQIRDLGVELDAEFVRKLSGRLEAGGFEDVDGAVVASDSIAFKATTDLAEVQRILGQMLRTVSESAAQDEFEFVDSLEPLRESDGTTKHLDAQLAEQVLYGRHEGAGPDNYAHLLEFAPPDEVQLSEVEDILVSYRDKEVTMEEFTLAALREALGEIGVRRGVGFLKGVRLIARGADGEERSQLSSLRNWLVYEAGDALTRYVLTLGRWFRLQESYTVRLNSDLERIEDVSNVLRLPNTDPTEHERAYNQRAADSSHDMLLMDRVGIQTADGRQVEACDLLHLLGHLIHAKRYNGSQTLSHLFSQGAVSAELFNEDALMKSDFIAKVASQDASFESIAQTVPTIVTYAIAIRDDYNLPLDLPTFSKVNLRDFARRLRRMKVTPTLARIRVIAPSAN